MSVTSSVGPGEVVSVSISESGSSLESNAAPAGRTCGTGTDQRNAGLVERVDQLHQRFDVAAHDVIARLHALDRRQRQAGELGECALVDSEQSPSRPHLCCRYHAKNIITNVIRI
jgi:hypothetical protein